MKTMYFTKGFCSGIDALILTLGHDDLRAYISSLIPSLEKNCAGQKPKMLKTIFLQAQCSMWGL